MSQSVGSATAVARHVGGQLEGSADGHTAGQQKDKRTAGQKQTQTVSDL